MTESVLWRYVVPENDEQWDDVQVPDHYAANDESKTAHKYEIKKLGLNSGTGKVQAGDWCGR
jgi:hypothetical protein